MSQRTYIVTFRSTLWTRYDSNYNYERNI